MNSWNFGGTRLQEEQVLDQLCFGGEECLHARTSVVSGESFALISPGTSKKAFSSRAENSLPRYKF